jgi:lipopolysaccharide transport system ATP-binding protein
MSISVSIEQLSKRYRLGGALRTDYATLRDRISGMFRRAEAVPDSTELWALRDVSLEIATGEALGLIGHNGAGKSTLLKILSRITEPTSGRAVLHGRVASLLEVGTGFHPELTGRENIFLNGAILGMTRDEIRRNFDAIVEFAEIERFLDTPVKRYSSGMYVRLAFAVAAHLTPEILLIDEVLAVGDIEFQRRCLGRMNEVARSGRTVVFVSHNLDSIERLCSRAVLLSRGTVAKSGSTRDVISYYVSQRGTTASSADLRNFPDREGTGRAKITGLELLGATGRTIDVAEFATSFGIRIHYETYTRLAGSHFGLAILDETNERVFLTNTREGGLSLEILEGSGWIDCMIDQPNLLPGIYFLEAWVTDEAMRNFADHLRMVAKFEIVVGERVSHNVAALTSPERGYVWIPTRWSIGSS